MACNMKKKGLLFYQQGWTDIMSQMALIDYYLTKYDHITAILRPDAQIIYEYYLKDKPNITKIYNPITHKSGVSPSFYEQFDKVEYDYLLHGKLDNNRYDQYKDRFMSDGNPSPDHFGRRFYMCYDIELETKINYFEFSRDINLENQTYDEFVNQHGSKYALYHDNMKNDSNIDISSNTSDQVTYINVNGITDNIFSMIKVLINAREIHVVDSFWASFCYVVDARYRLLKDADVYLYPFNKSLRHGGLIKDTSFRGQFKNVLNNAIPIWLDNWKIV